MPEQTEILIDDAREVWRRGFRRETLARLGERRHAIGLIAICGNADRVEYSCAWAQTEGQERALSLWLDGHVHHVLSVPEALAPLGMGTAILIGVEADGTQRAVTWSRSKVDCTGMAGWSDRWLFDRMSRCPWETHLGASHGGRPTGLTRTEVLDLRLRLSPAYQAAWLDTAPEAA